MRTRFSILSLAAIALAAVAAPPAAAQSAPPSAVAVDNAPAMRTADADYLKGFDATSVERAVREAFRADLAAFPDVDVFIGESASPRSFSALRSINPAAIESVALYNPIHSRTGRAFLVVVLRR